eukprot:CAMPEP_0194078242 /NCGR_PEP_ID=MMETSP0149-20130528/4690_1 /TAXON_ID=122233 /ORGANISM="Chaetoceros debilis, Strain MM31A-1" /LENGTH=424 /DNA_ID=CAMNT_0038759469 /DNA_START=130 /DNA_END=1401 /DNA_ORIENTATION=-
MAHDQSKFDTNPFGLKEQAEKWLITEQLQGNGNYQPYHSDSDEIGTDDQITEKFLHDVFVPHFKRGCVEHHHRSESKFHVDNPDDPLAVLVGVGFDEDLIEMSDEYECRPKARYLFFPKLGEEGQSALFITYISSDQHGSVKSNLSGQLYKWVDKHQELDKRLSKIVGGLQPDIRVKPKRRYTDQSLGDDADADPENDDCPFSRLIVELEWQIRDPAKLRQRGYTYFHKRQDEQDLKHVRMFLGCSLFGESVDVSEDEVAPNDLKYEAALVLWKRHDDNDEIQVDKAISFGTIELTEKHKKQYADEGSKMLPRVNTWERLGNKDETREMIIPKEGFLYKVFENSGPPFGNDTSNDDDPKYFTDDRIGNFIVDINKLAEAFEEELETYVKKNTVLQREVPRRCYQKVYNNQRVAGSSGIMKGMEW